MPDVVEWRQVSPRDVLVQAVRRLADGQLLIFPTDTCYIACAVAEQPDAVRRLAELPPSQGEAEPLHVAVTGVGQALDWVPEMSTPGQRLARRVWPGPLTLTFPAAGKNGLLTSLPTAVADRICRGGQLCLRAPCHEAILQVLQLLPGPVVFRPLLRPDGSEITEADDITAAPPADVELIIADGKTYFGQPATVVRISADGWQLTAPGVVTEEDLRRLTSCQIVFVCTGNTCRSPLAEALCKKMLADQLACTPDELPVRGYVVQSAGLSAVPGIEASPEAVVIAREYGADLSGHRSQPLTGSLLVQADHVLTMTTDHLHVLAPHEVAMLGPPRLLSCEGDDITDPIGAEPEVYRHCAQQILHHLQRRLPEFQPH